MPDSDSRPSERKIAALLLIAVVAAAIGIYSYGQEHPDTMNSISSVFRGMSFPTGFSIFSNSGSQVLLIEAELTFDAPAAAKTEFANPIETFSLSFEDSNNTFTIDRLPLQSAEKSEIILKNYTGSIDISNPMSLSGSAKSIQFGSFHSGKEIGVSASAFKINSAILSGVNGIDVELKNITGTVRAKDNRNSAVYSVSNNQLSISDFKGNIKYYGDKIILSGSGKMDTELLIVKNR